MDSMLNILGCGIAVGREAGENVEHPEFDIFQDLGELDQAPGATLRGNMAAQIAPLILALSSCRSGRNPSNSQTLFSRSHQCNVENPRRKFARLRGQLVNVRRQVAQLVNRQSRLNDRQLARFVSLLSQSLDLEVQLRKASVAMRGQRRHSSVPCNVRRERRRLRRSL